MSKPRQTRKPRTPRGKRGGGAVRKRGRVFYIRYCLNGLRHEEATEAANATEARTLLNERLGDVSRGKTPAAVSKVRVRELFDDVRADYENKGQDLETLDGRWKHLEPVFGSDYGRTVTHARMQGYIAARRVAEAADQTIKNELAVLRRMLRLGYQTGKVAQLPFFPTIAVNNVRPVFFADEEYDRLVTIGLPTAIAAGRNVGNDWLIPYTITIRWIGTRRGEVLRSERRQLDLYLDGDPGNGTLTLDPGTTKNGEGRVVYLPPEALAALRAWDERTRELERDRGIIIRSIFHRDGRPVREFPYDLWHAACAAANIPDRRIPHDFRRTAVRSYRRSGVSEGVVMDIIGHKTRSMFERYNIKNDDDRREAARQVARVSGGAMGQNGANRALVVPIAAAPRVVTHEK